MKIGVAGLGVVGGTLYRWLQANTLHDIFGEDPALQPPVTQRLSMIRFDVDVLFVCVPARTFTNLEQDLDIVDEVIERFGKSSTVFVRSSVVPGTCDALSKKHGRPVFAMPEFLTERTAIADFHSQSIICGAPEFLFAEQAALLLGVFNGNKKILLMKNVEAELAKYMHNGNGTVKVHFNNLVYQLAKKMGADYDRVRDGALMSGYVGANHTTVPGPDSKLGYGGKCFPKDLDALIGLMVQHDVPYGSLVEIQRENRTLRAGE